jgi:hypothetical protein
MSRDKMPQVFKRPVSTIERSNSQGKMRDSGEKRDFQESVSQKFFGLSVLGFMPVRQRRPYGGCELQRVRI